MAQTALRILQVLPELNSGGVERGTVDFARFLVEQGHHSMVMSSGGRFVNQLQTEGSQHIKFPIHKKSLSSFLKIGKLRKLLVQLSPDLIHLRSRMPAWLVWRALQRWPLIERPALVSTFHGLYSVNFYSAIMGRGDCVIAISDCVREYILNNYPKVPADKIYVVHRGVDQSHFNRRVEVDDLWRHQFEIEYPDTVGKSLVLMPGRLSAWKGQLEFIELMDCLVAKGAQVHGLIVGEPSPGKREYGEKLKFEVNRRGLTRHISFLGHRQDMPVLYKHAAVVVNMSQHAEPFGRTVIESLAVGTPVVAYNCGGPAESLRECLPQGLVDQNDLATLTEKVAEFINHVPTFTLPQQFTLEYQAQATLKVYQRALAIVKKNEA
jgi:glycosyltransferase involved in cell wall biosynthesis